MKNITKKLKHLTISVAVTFSCAVSSFAAGNESIIDSTGNVLVEYFGKLKGICIGGALVSFVLAICLWIWSPSEQGAQKGKQWMLRIVAGLFILFSIGGIYALITDVTAGSQLDIESIVK